MIHTSKRWKTKAYIMFSIADAKQQAVHMKKNNPEQHEKS